MQSPNEELVKMLKENQDRCKWVMDTLSWQTSLVGVLYSITQLASNPETPRDLLTHEAAEALKMCHEYIEKSTRENARKFFEEPE